MNQRKWQVSFELVDDKNYKCNKEDCYFLSKKEIIQRIECEYTVRNLKVKRIR